mmetsp:Transcript_30502/g.86194  ORF Transcript_30502/g.86194 Transcript_30502/m.86194 type:complete len:526 (-) Transcript_30502:97-1674(-)
MEDDQSFPAMSDLEVAALSAAGMDVLPEDDSIVKSSKEDSSSGEGSSSEEDSELEEDSSDPDIGAAVAVNGEDESPGLSAREAEPRGDGMPVFCDAEMAEPPAAPGLEACPPGLAAPEAAGDTRAAGQAGIVGGADASAAQGDNTLEDTSNREVDSDSGSSSDAESDSSDDVNFPGAQKIREMVNHCDSDEEVALIVSKNEVTHLPPPEPVEIELADTDQLEDCGVIATVVEDQIVVQAPTNARALAEGSILVLPDRTPIGRVEEVFGPVQAPFYITRYAGKETSRPETIKPGTKLMAVAKLADYVAQEKIYVKGYDTSGKDDEEVGEAEFSDDEKEAEYKRMQKSNKRKGGGQQKDSNLPPDMVVARDSSQRHGGEQSNGQRKPARGGGHRRGSSGHQHQEPDHQQHHQQYEFQPHPRFGPAMAPFPAAPYGAAGGMAGSGMPPGMAFIPNPYGMGMPQQMGPMYGMPPPGYGYMGYNPCGPVPMQLMGMGPMQPQQMGYGNQDQQGQGGQRGRGRGHRGGRHH